MTPKEIITKDGTNIEIDVLMLCTGYKYVFPFLSSEVNLTIKDERVVPLYKHLIHTQWPSMSFIGIPKTICPFPLFDCQIRFVLAALEGTMKLPSQQEMDADVNRDFQGRIESGYPVRHAHHMGPLQWDYNDDLAEIAGFNPIPKVVRQLYDHVHHYRVTDLPHYKEKNFALTGPTSFKEV